VFYVVAQFVGGMAGVLLMTQVVPAPVGHPSVHYVVTEPRDTVRNPRAVGAEVSVDGRLPPVLGGLPRVFDDPGRSCHSAGLRPS
jgi:hypothetical protein